MLERGKIQEMFGVCGACLALLVLSLVLLPAAAGASVGDVGSDLSMEAGVATAGGPAPVAALSSVLQRADCNMTCEGDCCTETCCGPDGCETCKTCCPGGDCNKYCYEHKKGKKPAGKK